MEPNIRLDMRLGKLMEEYPESRAVFDAHGLGNLVSAESLQAVGPFLTLETALKAHDIAPSEFLKLLCASRDSGPIMEAPGMSEAEIQGATRLMTLMPCGLKVPFGKSLAAFISDLPADVQQALNYAVESNVNHELSYYPYVGHIQSVDELPDVIVSSDFNDFFHRRFYERFVRPKTHFANAADYAPNALFTDAGVPDPLGQYIILCVNPLVVVADLEKAGDRPLPRRWEDLLDSMWNRSITLRGNEDFFCHAVLLPLFKEHGISAMKALAENVYDGRHPSQMVKTAGNGKSAALYVMPDFFSRKLPSSRAVKRIWPEDGALASPVTLLVKKDAAVEFKAVVDYLTGKSMAQVFSGAYFPSPRPDIDNGLSDDARLKWLGWDYIRENDLKRINKEIDDVFLPIATGGKGS